MEEKGPGGTWHNAPGGEGDSFEIEELLHRVVRAIDSRDLAALSGLLDDEARVTVDLLAGFPGPAGSSIGSLIDLLDSRVPGWHIVAGRSIAEGPVGLLDFAIVEPSKDAGWPRSGTLGMRSRARRVVTLSIHLD